MTDAAEKLRPNLLALSGEDREELAWALLESLEPPHSAAEEKAFEEELARREEEMRNGRIVGLTAEEFFADINAHLASLKEAAKS